MHHQNDAGPRWQRADPRRIGTMNPRRAEATTAGHDDPSMS